MVELGAIISMLFRAIAAVLAGGLFIVAFLLVVFFIALIVKSMYQSLTGRKTKNEKQEV